MDRQTLERRKAAQALCRSEHFAALQSLAETFASTYTAAPPTMPEMLLGYVTGCVIKDGLSCFLQFIADEAAVAPPKGEDDE